MLSIFAQQKMLAAADGPADAPAPQPVHAQMKRKHRSKSSRSKHAQRGTERGYTQVARDAVRIAGYGAPYSRGWFDLSVISADET